MVGRPLVETTTAIVLSALAFAMGNRVGQSGADTSPAMGGLIASSSNSGSIVLTPYTNTFTPPDVYPVDRGFWNQPPMEKRKVMPSSIEQAAPTWPPGYPVVGQRIWVSVTEPTICPCCKAETKRVVEVEWYLDGNQWVRTGKERTER